MHNLKYFLHLFSSFKTSMYQGCYIITIEILSSQNPLTKGPHFVYPMKNYTQYCKLIFGCPSIFSKGHHTKFFELLAMCFPLEMFLLMSLQQEEPHYIVHRKMQALVTPNDPLLKRTCL